MGVENKLLLSFECQAANIADLTNKMKKLKYVYKNKLILLLFMNR